MFQQRRIQYLAGDADTTPTLRTAPGPGAQVTQRPRALGDRAFDR